MPGLIVPPGFAQTKLLWTLSGDMEQMVCTLGVELPTGQSDPRFAAEDMGTMWASVWPATATADFYHFDGCWAQLGQDGGGGPVAISTTGAYQGTMSTASPPQNVAVLVRKMTSVGGRKHKGRMYLPPFIGEGGIDQLGRVESASSAVIQGRLDDFYTELTTTTGAVPRAYPPVVFHNNYGAATPDPTPVTSFYLDPVVGTQRRRLRR